ncbi:MAG: response regulator [Desulfobulbaceae bacterium]|nr:response regulator [Desulfobulbaceae bacterium]
MINTNIQILVVDDVESIRKITKPILISLGFLSKNLYTATDGEKALKVLKNEHIDLVICEWNIPKITGLELLKTVRGDSILSSLPFIILTSTNDQNLILQAAQEKVSQYIIKPFTSADLGMKLQQLFLPCEKRAHFRHTAHEDNQLIVLKKGKRCTVGKVINVSQGGLLAKLLIRQDLTIHNELDLHISFSDSSKEKYVNIIPGEIVRIERNPKDPDKKTAHYGVIFKTMDFKQKEFLNKLIAWLKA